MNWNLVNRHDVCTLNYRLPAQMMNANRKQKKKIYNLYKIIVQFTRRSFSGPHPPAKKN